MKAAILLGQSEYKNIDQIPACKNDLTVMCDLIKATDRFDQILVIDDQCKNAEMAKEKLINFVELLKYNETDELFFYFTGHGYFDGNEFFYIWGDFDPTKKRQTSLQSTETDELLVQFNPKLFVKVIDSCNAGNKYIKDVGSVEKFFNDTRKTFNKFYFFFSSHNDQFSLADVNHSFFSSSFIQSIGRSEGRKIRYKDIIDFISDSFEKLGKQTPLFITEAEFTEVFCTVNKKIKKIIQNYLDGAKTYYFNTRLFSSLSEVIKIDAEKYVDFDTAKQCLLYSLESVKLFKIDKDLEYCYEKEVKVNTSYDVIPKIDILAHWIAQSNPDLFVNIIYEHESCDGRMPINIFASLDHDVSNKYDTYQNIGKDIKIPKLFENKFDLPFVTIFLTLKSKFSNILNYSFALVPILSRTQIYYFYTKLNYNRIDWDDQEIDPASANWELEKIDFNYFTIRTKINRLIQDKFISVIMDDLTLKFHYEANNHNGNHHPPG
jgi:hypothetical protein